MVFMCGFYIFVDSCVCGWGCVFGVVYAVCVEVCVFWYIVCFYGFVIVLYIMWASC